MIQVDISKCTGCRRCETACAFFHTGRTNRHLARIKVGQLYSLGIDGPVLCRQCQERYCLRCPEEALTIGSWSQVIYSPTVCTLCGFCEKACPIGAIEIFNKIVFVCDLCGGNPRCVEACTEGALMYTPGEDKNPPSLAAIKAKTKKLTPPEKREFYMKKLSREIRKKWRKADA